MTRRRPGALALDALTWTIVVVMVAPVVWLLLSALQTNLQIANGTYDFLHADVRRVLGDVADRRLRALLRQQPDHLHGGGADRDGVRVVRRLRARALPLPRARARSASP